MQSELFTKFMEFYYSVPISTIHDLQKVLTNQYLPPSSASVCTPQQKVNQINDPSESQKMYISSLFIQNLPPFVCSSLPEKLSSMRSERIASHSITIDREIQNVHVLLSSYFIPRVYTAPKTQTLYQ